MRFTIRRLSLACLLLTCTALFYFSTAPHFPSLTDVGQYSQTGTESSGETNKQDVQSRPADLFVQQARAFWEPWAKAFLEAKPQVRWIKVKSAARNVAAGGSFPREKPVSRISLPPLSLESLRSSHARLRAQLDAYDGGNLYSGAGVVTVAGGEYFGPAIVGIKMLRQTGSKLPVEAFLANWDEYEAEVCEEVLPKLGARCIVLTDFTDSDKREKETRFDVTHYQLKSLALLFSTFSDVLYLDSDSIPLLDPSELFNAEPYTSTGLVGWPDFWVGSEAPQFYTIAGMDGFPEDLPLASSEAGQLLVDKSRHLKTLLLAAYYNIWGPDWFYPLLSQGALGQGDKNTFETAAVVLNAPYYRVKTPVQAVGRRTGGEFRGSGMVQFHPGMDFQASKRTSAEKAEAQGEEKEIVVKPAFLHANTPKMNAGHLVSEGDLIELRSREPLRLWGTVEDQKKLFGEDLERRAFELVVETGCELEMVLNEWKSRGRVCERLQAHFEKLFM